MSKRYDRQIRLFGQEGQQKIASQVLMIAGLGGLGSHVAQQLAYLGVQSYTLIDPDVVEVSNLNRLIGAVEADVSRRTPKIEVAKRLILSIQPQARVSTLQDRLMRNHSSLLDGVTFIFGCLDNDLARLTLTDLAASRGVPYLDLATDTGVSDAGEAWYGGRLLFADKGERCLSCMDLLDQREMSRESMTDTQRIEDDAIYGVDRSGLSETGPAVVSINGAVASLGVTEFMAWATRVRDPWPLLSYRGDLGRVSLNKDSPRPNCYYCKKVWPPQPN